MNLNRVLRKVPVVAGYVERKALVNSLENMPKATATMVLKSQSRNVKAQNLGTFERMRVDSIKNNKEKISFWTPLKNKQYKDRIKTLEGTSKEEMVYNHAKNYSDKMNEENAKELLKAKSSLSRYKTGVGVGAAGTVAASVALAKNAKNIKGFITKKIIQKRINKVIKDPIVQAGTGLVAGSVVANSIMNKRKTQLPTQGDSV
jgi:hypothetical protein